MRTFSGWPPIVLVLVCAVLVVYSPIAKTALVSGPAPEVVQETPLRPQPGQVVMVHAYCVGVDREFMRRFTEVLTVRGMEAYRQIMGSDTIPCFDSRVHDLTPQPVVLRTYLWDVILPSGEELQFWENSFNYICFHNKSFLYIY